MLLNMRVDCDGLAFCSTNFHRILPLASVSGSPTAAISLMKTLETGKINLLLDGKLLA